MFSTSLRRTLSGLLIFAQLLPSLALAGYECTTTTTSSSGGTSLGSVFSVIGDGTITVLGGDKANDHCNLYFLNGSKVNAKDGKFVHPGTGNDTNSCQDILNHSVVTTSGHSENPRTLTDFLSSTSSTDVTADGKDQTIASGEYGTVKMMNGGTVTIAGGARIKSLDLSGCNGKALTIAPGTYFIDSVSWQAQCNLVVSGTTGTATLNFKNGFTLTGGPTCLNFSHCGDTTTANLAAQSPERLQINVYSGNFVSQNNVSVAAGIYVDKGAADLSSGPMTMVGEVLANSITVQNNNDSRFYSKPSSMQKTDSTTTTPATTPSFYTMVPPAIPQIATAGTDFGFRAGQINAAAGISGHLKAYKVLADGNLSTTEEWDAAAKIAEMTDADRRAKMMTDASGSFIAITDLMKSDDSVKAYGERILNPNADKGKYLNGRDPASLIGRPWKTTPIIVGDSVLFAADDGFLYSVKSSDGTLNWAWMPSEILPLGADPAALMNAHPWGQIATYSQGGKTYVTGSALSGALHFALQVSEDGTTLSGADKDHPAPVWQDYRSDKSSPAYPFGGDAPQMATQTEGTAAGKIAYIVDNKLVIRKLDGTGTASASDLTPIVSSNLFYYSDSEFYFGDVTGRIQKSNSSGVLQTSPGSLDLAGGVVQSVTGALVNDASGNSLVLLAQTSSRVTAIKRDPAGTWEIAWHTAVGSASTGVTSIDSGTIITAPPEITKGKVMIPVTKPGSAAFCAEDEAYNFGPLDLVSGHAAMDNVKFKNNAVTSLMNKIGSGMATGIVLFTVQASNTFTDVAYASTGTGGAPFTMDRTKTKTRLNWRELTTYF